MPILDFKEIPQANISDGRQDTFEMLARDFFEMLKFKILSGPDRGQDGGRDLILLEKRMGVIGETEVRWLVSCKHKSHSGKSVTDGDEQDITDRLKAHNCKGFIGFYSTLLSSPLSRKLDALKNEYEVKIFDKEQIENILLSNKDGFNIIKRYFPEAYKKISSKRPSNLLSEYEPLKCKYCGKDLLSEDIVSAYKGIIVFVKDYDYWKSTGKIKYVDIYWSCKGKCDRILEDRHRQNSYITSWQDISDVTIPLKYVQWNMAILNRLRDDKDIYTDEAFDKLKQFIIRISQIVLKEQTPKEIQRVISLQEIPDYL